MNRILPIIIYLFPLQLFAVEISTTRFDLFPLSILFVLIIEILYFGKLRYLNKLGLIMLLIFFGASALIWILFRYAPISRFASALLWLSTLIYLSFGATNFYSHKFYINLLKAVLASVIVLAFQYFVLKEDRPRAFYIEPSTAGLIFYSITIMLCYKFLYLGLSKIKKLEIFFALIFFLSGLLTKSSHLVLFFIVPIIFMAYNLNFKTLLAGMFLIFPIFGLLIYFLINDPYVISKFNFSNSEEFNLSQLAWLRGLDQAIYVFKHSPIFGYGIGSTGMFNFVSDYTSLLDKTEFPDLNLLDAYSLFFRLVIEIGFACVVLIFVLLHRKIKKIMSEFRLRSSPSTINQQSLFVFGFSIFLGSLIKEPNYGLSPLFVSVICMSFSITGK